MDRQNIISWINELKKMEENHLPELDHKDCGEISELLYCLMKEVEHLKISEFNQDRIKQWMTLTMENKSDPCHICRICDGCYDRVSGAILCNKERCKCKCHKE